MTWRADCDRYGWHVVFEKGRAWISFRPDQWGKIRSCSSQYCDYEFARLCNVINGLGGPRSRHSHRFSRERRALCERVAAYLNCISDPPIARVIE